jgi:acetylornithine/succinyldiaminopimelate/putrescine aminotransferase
VLAEGIRTLAGGDIGDALRLESIPEAEPSSEDDGLAATVRETLGADAGVSVDSLILAASADEALERAVAAARLRDPERFKTVALVGADHGRTALCRAASGLPELQRGLEPLVAGFRHVPPNEIDALRAAVDEQTACVLLSPLSWSDAMRPLEESYLQAAAEITRSHSALLVIDESRLMVGAGGVPFSFRAIQAGVEADAVILSAGLFGGVTGGMLIASHRLTGEPTVEASRFPLQQQLAECTLRELARGEHLAGVETNLRSLAVMLAETLRGHDFVRDLHVLGRTVGIETELPARSLVSAAWRCGLAVETAGHHAIRLQLPLVISESDRDEFLSRLAETLDSAGREASTADVSQYPLNP